MEVYDWVVFALIVTILIILYMKRNTDTFTTQEFRTIDSNSFTVVSPGIPVPTSYVCDIVISQLSGNNDTALAKMNSLITNFNTITPAMQMPLITNTTEFDQIFTTAFNSSESAFGNDSVGKRNKMILRTFAGLCGQMVNAVSTFLPITYDSTGKPTFTDEIVQASGKTVNEVLTYGLKTIKAVFAGGGETSISADTLVLINSIFPSTIPTYTSASEMTTELSTRTNLPPRAIFFAKAYIIGSAYIMWLVTNKWKLDPAWSAGLPSSPAIRA